MPPQSSATFTSGVTTSTFEPRLAMKSATPAPACVLTPSNSSTFCFGSTLPVRMSHELTASPSATPQPGTCHVKLDPPVASTTMSGFSAMIIFSSAATPRRRSTPRASFPCRTSE